MKIPPALLLLVAAAWCAAAQNLLPNPGFEEGEKAPAGWWLEGAGEWAVGAPAGSNRVLRVRGNGADSSVWRTGPLPLQSGSLYALRFRGRRLPDAAGGTAVAGTSRVNRDFPLDAEWREYRFVFRQPDDVPEDFVRLGQWHVRGGVEFDEVELRPVLAGQRRIRGPGGEELELGEGEWLTGDRYGFSAHLGWAGANVHRTLVRATAHFNTDRWVFTPGAGVVYRFALPGAVQTRAKVSVSLNHHVAGALAVEAGRDGEHWEVLGRFDGQQRGGVLEVPAVWFPADELWVRLRAPEPGTALQVNRLDYEAGLASPVPEGFGETRFLEVMSGRAPALITWRGFVGPENDGRWRFDFAVANPDPEPLRVTASLTGPVGAVRPGRARRFGVAPGTSGGCVLDVALVGGGTTPLTVAFLDGRDRLLLRGRVEVATGLLEETGYGYRLASGADLDLWWCESGWKVGRQRALPGGPRSGAVRVSAARGEFEAVQVVLRPRRAVQLQEAAVTAFRDGSGREVPLEITVHEVAYVPVTHPTDATSRRGWYPDPLPPLTLPRVLEPGVNLPLWVTVYVPREVPGGEYRTEMILRTGADRPARVPLAVRVYDFELPRESHLRSAFGLGTGAINQYHRLTNRADQVVVFEKYLQNFAEHRISPYSFFEHAPIGVRFEGEGANKRARVDFTAFDAAAARWLDGRGLARGSPFNSFQLPLRGMGGGTFHSRHLGELEGFREGTPEHARLFGDYLGQVERHLRERGWLDRAFTYWFDEPDPKDYEFVVAGQQRIKAAAPALKRMLTEQPEPELLGQVDIWCALTPEWTPEKVRARRAAGEEVWWYICTVPKAPYVTEFIDHPGTELRLWPWQSWQYGVNGILVWATTYWHSPEAYPDALQDPWQDPMSWVTSYGTPQGTRLPWGNGDGRFLYPPRRDPNSAVAPCLDGPINSVRWENLRDGLEDYEYFWRLEQEVKRVGERKQAGAGGDGLPGAELLAEARALLVVPANVSRDLTHFTTDPRPLLEHRDRLARMIERLQRVR